MNTIRTAPPHEPPQRGFSDSEFSQRLQTLQAGMQQCGMDALLLSTEADVRYYSGFMTQFWQSPTRPWFLVVPQSGEPTAVIPSIGAACMGRTWIRDIRTWSSPHPTDDGISLLGDALLQCAGDNASLGLPMGAETHLRMPLADFSRLKKILGHCRWRDAGPLLQSQRQIKSAAEIDKIRHSCQLASCAFEQLPGLLSAGMSEIDVFCVFKQLCLSLGVDDISYLVGSSGKQGYGDIISPPSARRLQREDLLILDTGCQWDGYFCDFDRNYSVIATSSAVADAHTIVWEATQAGLEFIRPGVRCAEVFELMHRHMSPYAVDSAGEVGRLGHGLGLQLTETPSFSAFDQSIIREGMVLTLEPGYSFAAGKIMVHEENIVIRADGAELLSRRAPATLPMID